MKRYSIRTLTLILIAGVVFPPASSQAEQCKDDTSSLMAAASGPSIPAPGRPTTKRIWTNDDFAPSSPTEEPQAAKEEPAPPTQAAAATEDDPALQDARREVQDEMATAARTRQKAYQDTIGIVQGKLETETNEFRIKVYQQILRDTLKLQEINQHMMEQFSGRPAEEEPRQESAAGTNQS